MLKGFQPGAFQAGAFQMPSTGGSTGSPVTFGTIPLIFTPIPKPRRRKEQEALLLIGIGTE